MNADWMQVHRDATVVDMHVHPSIKVSLFNRVLWRSFNASRYFNPLSVRTDFDGFTDPPDDLNPSSPNAWSPKAIARRISTRSGVETY
jgi:hypothetical protein